MKEYLVYQPNDGPNPLKDAKRFGNKIKTCFGAEDALHDFLEAEEANGNFCEGFPQSEEYFVVDCETGEEEAFKVDTEFEPSYYIYKD